jgi:hypothetical protein
LSPMAQHRNEAPELLDATYLAVGPDELRRKAAEGDDRALYELARAAA